MIIQFDFFFHHPVGIQNVDVDVNVLTCKDKNSQTNKQNDYFADNPYLN